ncbi:MAG: HD domain-containing protein [Candidatus Nanoarchaeia archaeon]|jgi:uncharacterized protein
MKVKLSDLKDYYSAGGHGTEHINRVYNNALRIAKIEQCDVEVVKAAALMHDIARHLDESNPNGPCHAEQGAEMARELLKEYDYTPAQQDNIVHSIRVHRYSTQIKPETIEAGILQDADRLDALGAMIIARVFYQAGKHHGSMHDPSIPAGEYKGAANTTTAINHFYEKILKIKPETFNTKKGQELARERYEYVKEFVKRFLAEWNCEV